MSSSCSALLLPLLCAKFTGICLTTGLRQLKSNKPRHADVVQRLCYSRLNSLTRTTPAGCTHSTILMLKSPQALCTPYTLCETLGANARLCLEDSEDEELPPSLWTSSVLKKRRKKMNKHKYKKRKRRDRYKTKLT